MARIILGVTGSVAAVKVPELWSALAARGHELKLAPTGASLAFFDPALPPAGSGPSELFVRGQDTVYFEADEWPVGRRFQVGEPVVHIELRKWADLLLIAPLDANTLAKLSLGLSDNLLTSVYRAWDLDRPVVLAPAMNTLMWDHPATSRHLVQLLEDFGGTRPLPHLDAEALSDTINGVCPRLRIVKPVSKRLACGDEGMGGMASLEEIVAAVEEALAG